MLDQEEIVAALQASQNNLNAFLPVYEHYVDRIYSYCLYRVHSAQDAEDLTSQIFARAMDRCHTYKGGNVGAWLFRIAYHITIDHFRAKHPVSLSDDVLITFPDGQQKSPLDHVIHDEQIKTLYHLLNQLEDDKRNLLLLRITGNLSAADVGAIVGKSAGAVRVEIHRIVQSLKQLAQELP